MPTRAPSAWRASARLTAVVDLPTPPLPEATVFLDFVGVDFLAHVDVHVLDTIDVFQGVTDQLFQGSCDAFRGVWQLDHEGNVPVVVGIEGFNGTQFVEVLVEVGIAVLANRCLQGLL